ncbi:hypothetical protein CANARDRAFT_29596 [[Candida] arabinofermentans NRRL YB-2248]|uniref:Uncharacterized protein n=1 Tax=[Candida] arabinofermentans NRRL YB-2248 TaxID=983967 RepID=A0A1E4SWK1_9ASCO|nr:hypothetical protein CANARDRAFT_29596 [[Candida] arabinofermentans NRRL YB-2248]
MSLESESISVDEAHHNETITAFNDDPTDTIVAQSTSMDIQNESLVKSTYTKNLTEQIKFKRKLIEVAKAELAKLESEERSNESLDDDEFSKLKTIALFETLNKLPYQPPRNDLIGVSLAESDLGSQLNAITESLSALKDSNRSLEQKLENLQQTSKIYDELKSTIEEKTQLETEKYEELINHDAEKAIDELKNVKNRTLSERSKKLIELSKKIISDYILKNEFNIFFNDEELEVRKAKFLKLLEILLNNAITVPNNEEVKYLEVENTDDPLIRYLISNNIVVADPKRANRIKLTDFTVNA